MPENLATDAKAFADNFAIEELPSVSYVRLWRGKIRIVCEDVVSCRLSNASECKQEFAYETSRRQTNVMSLVLDTT